MRTALFARCNRAVMSRVAMLSIVLFSLWFALVPRPAAAHSSYAQQVQLMYIAYYGRPGDPAGVDYWAGELSAVGGNWIPELVDAFGQSEEYIARFGALDDETLVNNLFLGLFNRSADDVGLAYYVDLLNGSDLSGFNTELRQTTIAQIALDIANGVQPDTDDAAIVSNKLAVAAFFTDSIRASGRAYGANEIATAVDFVADVDQTVESVQNAIGQIAEFAPIASRTPPINDAGLSYTKLDANGNVLAADSAQWSCVRDDVTQLTWEVKTDDDGLHDRDHRYSWYSTNAMLNAGVAGFAFAPGATGCHGYDSNDPTTYCNTDAYVARVNARALCGVSNWRLPTRAELISLMINDRAMPPVDTDYFPNTVTNAYWSSSTDGYSVYAWYGFFGYGASFAKPKQTLAHVRLVHDQP